MNLNLNDTDPDYDRDFLRALIKENNPAWTEEQIDMELIRLTGCTNELGL
jgi:hypothetical protein